MYSVFHLASHNCKKEEGTLCFCEKKGFTSPNMAAVYAYHHLRCRACRDEQSAMSNGWELFKKTYLKDETNPNELSFYKDEVEHYLKYKTLEDKWHACPCSSEWMISKTDGEDDE